MTFLHSLFALAMQSEWAASDPVARAARARWRRVGEADPDLQLLTLPELDAVIATIPDRTVDRDALGPLPRLVILAAATSGLRQSELLGSVGSTSIPMRIMFSFMGVPEGDRPQLKQWCGSRASLAWGRPTPEEALHHAQQMVLYRRFLRELVAGKVTDRGDDFASALLEIHDEDPDALSQEDIASILFSRAASPVSGLHHQNKSFRSI